MCDDSKPKREVTRKATREAPRKVICCRMGEKHC